MEHQYGRNIEVEAIGAWPYLGAGGEHVEDAARHVEACVAADAAGVDAAPVRHPIWDCWGRAQHYLADHRDPQIHLAFGANIAAIVGRCC